MIVVRRLGVGACLGVLLALVAPPTVARPDGSNSSSASDPLAPQQVSVAVFNGSGVPAAAATLANKLRGLGYVITVIGNADAPAKHTTVACRAAFESEAKALRDVVDGAKIVPFPIAPPVRASTADCIIVMFGSFDNHNPITDRKYAGGTVETVAVIEPGGPCGGTVPADPITPSAVAVGPAEDVYVADFMSHAVCRLESDGSVAIVVGPEAFSAHGPSVTSEEISPLAIDVGPDGALYIAEGYGFRVLKLSRLGLERIAGTGYEGHDDFAGEAATAFSLGWPIDVNVDATGAVWFADHDGPYRISPGGVLEQWDVHLSRREIQDLGVKDPETLVGKWSYTSVSQIAPDERGGAFVQVQAGILHLRSRGAADVVVATDEFGRPVFSSTCGLFVLASGGIEHVSANGKITSVTTGAGFQSPDEVGLGPSDLALGPDGALYVADYGGRVFRYTFPDGIRC